MHKIKVILFATSLSTCLADLQGQSKHGDKFIDNAISKQETSAWQREIATKAKKDIVDYFLLLPKSILEAEIGIKNDSKDFRLQSASNAKGRINRNAGFLIASPDVRLEMALFKDKVNNKDIVALVLGCGEPPVQYCDYGFLEFDQQNHKWIINRDVFPWKEFDNICEDIKSKEKNSGIQTEGFIPNIVLPEIGTTIDVIDAWDSKNPKFKVLWNGQTFEIK